MSTEKNAPNPYPTEQLHAAANEPPPPYSTTEPPKDSNPQFPPQHPHQTTTVIITAPAMLGDRPVNMVCPNCQAQVVTNLVIKNGLLTWLLVGGLCVFGCVFGCCLIPFCVDACKDVEHFCPNCKAYLGTKKRI